MATYNTNSLPEPISPSTWDTAQAPDPNIGAQTFLGCTVASFNVSADLAGRGGQLNVNLIEDTDPVSGFRQKLQDPNIYDVATNSNGSLPLVGSPQYFKVLDTSSNTVFQYNGILKSIGRRVSPNGGKTHSVALSGPMSILANATIILDKYAGFGFAQEGIPNINSINSYYQVGSNLDAYELNHFDTLVYQHRFIGLDENLTGDVNPVAATTFDLDINAIPPTGHEVGLSLATNNRDIIWNDVYNLINVFGFFESESHGFAGNRGYGYSSSNSSGMKLSYVIAALDQLMNRTSSSSAQRYFGGNLLSGTSSYNICAIRDDIINSNPYYYGVDFLGFISQLTTILTTRYSLSGYSDAAAKAQSSVDNYELSQSSTDLASLITSICSSFGIEFIVRLNEVSYTAGSTTNYSEGPYYSDPSNDFVLEKTNQGFGNSTQLGGVISIHLLDRSKVRCDRPFSSIAYNLLGLEVPDFGDYGIAGRNINPGIRNPFSPAFDLTSAGPSYIDPLDDDYNNRQAEGSTPYGGKFPVETKLDSAGTLLQTVLNRAQSSDLSIVNVESVTAKMVLGGPISRIVDVPRKHIYQYWGDINIYPTGTTCAVDNVSSRSHPVITQILPHDDIYDHILIDMKDILPDNVCQGVAYKGIYSASISEIRMAMSNKGRWRHFLKILKPCKWAAIQACAGIDEEGIMRDIGNLYAVTGATNGTPTILDQTVEPTYENQANAIGGINPVGGENTTIGRIKPIVSSTDRNYHNSLDTKTLVEKIHQKIKSIGDAHYGKSWVAWMPHMETKLTNNNKEVISSYEKSWSISQNAYLEPSGYQIIDAPQSSKFIENHKVSSYSNFEYSLGDNLHIFNDAFTKTGDIEAFKKSPGNDSFYVYDFSEINPDSIHISECSDSGIAHTKIEVDEKYVNLPYDYFAQYLRTYNPFVSPTGGTDARSYYQLSERSDGLINYSDAADIYDDVPSKRGRSNAQKLRPNTRLLNSVISDDTHSFDTVTFDKYDVLCDVAKSTHLSTNVDDHFTGGQRLIKKSWEVIDDFLDLRFPDNAQDCFHFVKFQTERVFNPLTKAKGFGFTDGKIVADLYRDTVDFLPAGVADEEEIKLKQIKQDKTALNIDPLKDSAFPVCIPPLSVGIPQVSNRYYYGPWFTDNKFIFAGKTQFLHDTNLVPENFVMPVYGDIESSAFNYFDDLSGTVGLNNAAKAFANSIDGFKLFANENGSITIPGAPLIKNIGDVFFSSDPNDQTYILGMTVQASPQGITTTYNFGSNQPRLDDIPKEYAEKIQKFSEQASQRIQQNY